MPHRDIIVIGASAGGLPALIEMLRSSAVDLPAAIFVAVHTSPESSGLLPRILARGGAWMSAYAEDEEPIGHGRIYVAPADHHLLLKRGHVRVTRGPRENRFRPAVDPLFRTAARAYGARVIGVILSGGLDDGTHGLEIIKRHGGIAIAQDPEEAITPGMPLSAIQSVEVDFILTAADIGARLATLVREEVEDAEAATMGGMDIAEGISDNLKTGQVPGPPSPFTCPDCGGSLWEMEEGRLLRYRCHVGHAYSADSLVADQGEVLETTLWSALRALEEQAALRRRMAAHSERVGRGTTAAAYIGDAQEAEQRAEALRQFLLRDVATKHDLPTEEGGAHVAQLRTSRDRGQR